LLLHELQISGNFFELIGIFILLHFQGTNCKFCFDCFTSLKVSFLVYCSKKFSRLEKDGISKMWLMLWLRLELLSILKLIITGINELLDLLWNHRRHTLIIYKFILNLFYQIIMHPFKLISVVETELRADLTLFASWTHVPSLVFDLGWGSWV